MSKRYNKLALILKIPNFEAANTVIYYTSRQ